MNADEYPQRYTSTRIFECVRILAKPLDETLLEIVDAASDAKRRRWLDRMEIAVTAYLNSSRAGAICRSLRTSQMSLARTRRGIREATKVIQEGGIEFQYSYRARVTNGTFRAPMADHL